MALPKASISTGITWVWHTVHLKHILVLYWHVQLRNINRNPLRILYGSGGLFGFVVNSVVWNALLTMHKRRPGFFLKPWWDMGCFCMRCIQVVCKAFYYMKHHHNWKQLRCLYCQKSCIASACFIIEPTKASGIQFSISFLFRITVSNVLCQYVLFWLDIYVLVTVTQSNLIEQHYLSLALGQ